MLKTPRNLPRPRSAWLLYGDEASFPVDGLYADEDENFCNWTACPHIEIGDTLFFYFMAPRKAIHFVGRAKSRPYFDRSQQVASDTHVVNRHQWWVDYEAVVQVDPISLQEINAACDEPLIMRGRSGKYIRPKAANGLLQHARISYSAFPWCERAALEKVVGRSELPASDHLDLQTLSDLPASLLRLEADVEEFVIEPLYHLLRLRRGYRLQRRFQIGRQVADYAIFKDGRPHCIIEAKLRTQLDRDRNWGDSPHVQQAQEYANHFKVKFLIIDCEELFCFDADTLVPRLQFDRRRLTNEDLREIRSHITARDQG